MLGSSWLDLCVGLDIHFEMVPTPAPVPMPFPNPFIGMIFDPIGLLVSLGISAAFGSPGGPVLVNGMPATNTGTEAVAIRTSPRNLGHSEQLLLQGGSIHGQHHAPLVTDLDGLKAIVTERSPCKGCTSMLEQMLPEDFPVYYFVEHTPGQESRMAREINDIRKSCH